MELTSGQQRLLFVVVVLALAGLGIYLLGDRGSGGTPAAAPSASTASTASTPQPSPSGTVSPGSTGATSVPPSTVPAPTPASTVGGAEIYQWLPFTPADLAAAAKTTTTFATAYTTWSYTEDKAAYGAKLSGLVTAPYLTILEGEYSTSGVAGPRAADKQVSAGRGTIDSISLFGSGSITFMVTIAQQVTSTQPTTKVTGQYAITVVSAGNAWQVSNIELSKLGNE